MPQRCATATQYPPPASRTILTPCALLVHPRAQSRLNLKRLRLWLLVAAAFIAILLLGNGGLIAFVTAIYKDTYVKGDTTMSDANGKVVLTGKATHNLPLIVAPVLPEDELFSVETLRVTLPGSTSGPPELGSGEAINEVIPGVVNSVRISRVEKVNSTAVVFYGHGGEEIRVWNGVTTARLSATGPRSPFAPPTSPARPSKSRAPSWRRSTWPRPRPCSSRLRRAAAGWPTSAMTRSRRCLISAA